MSSNEVPVRSVREERTILYRELLCHSLGPEKIGQDRLLRRHDVRLRMSIFGRGSRMHSPAVNHLWDMHSGVSGECKAEKQVPVRAALCRRIGISSKPQSLISTHNAQEGDIRQVCEKHRVPIRLEIWLGNPGVRYLVLVCVEYRWKA